MQYIPLCPIVIGGAFIAIALTSIKVDKRLADEAAAVLGTKSRSEAVRVALR